MAEDYRGRALPPRDNPDDSHYPPPPGEDDDRARAYQAQLPSMASTLPPIASYAPAPAGRGYPPPPDPRARGSYSASPTSANGYAPPATGAYSLPPVQVPDARAYGRGDYYQQGAYAHDPYNPYGSYRGPPPVQGYSPYPDYRVGPSVATQQPAAPRQRTSIACRYCRKRKIRCSGYQNTPDGKCTNCKKTGNDCVFQPVSSSASTAFVPVSAVPGGVPPGTPLYGAFGQPLAPAHGAHSPGQATFAAPGSSSDYQLLPSPTASSYYPHPDDRTETGRRRPRAEDDHGPRLPPPNVYPDDDPRRRSPASAQSGTPPTYSYSKVEYEGDNRTPPRRNSPGSSHQAGSVSTPNSMMSLSNLMDHPPARGPADTSRDIDQNMLGRLNRRP